MIKIILENNDYLICEGNFEITKRVADISDITKRSGTFSKGIDIPGSKENIKVLGGYFDVNLIASSFDHNKKYKCSVEVDGVVMEDRMIFKLTDIIKSKQAHTTDSDKVLFKGVVYNDVSSFYSSMGGKLVTDLKIHKPTDSHDLNFTDIKATYYPSENDRYVYLLPHKEDYKYYVNQFVPAIFGKVIWDAIFESNGFTYEWSELTDNDVQFDKWVFPFTGKYTASDYTRKKLQVIIGQDPNPLPNESPTDNSWTQITYPAHTGLPTAAPNNMKLWDENIALVNTGLGGRNLGRIPYFYANRASYMQIIDNEVLDTSGQYNDTTGVFTPDIDAVYDFKIEFDYDFDLVATANSTLITTSVGYLEYEILPFFTEGTTMIFGSMGSGASIKYYKNDTITTGSNTTTGTHIMTLTATLDSSKTYNLMGFALYVNRDKLSNVNWQDASNNDIDVTPKLTITDITVTITPRSGWQENIPVNLNDLLPQKIKQSEFIKSILTMTNSYIDADESQSNKLIIKSRDKYYDDGEEKDFRKYLDVGKESEITFISNDNNKKIELTYKEDKDAYNEAYQSSTQRVYGNATFTLVNEHIKGEEVKKIDFTPTPYAVNQFQAALPVLRTLPEQKETGIKVLLYNGYKTVSSNVFEVYNSGGLESTESYYPEALHCNDPYFPNLDLNFGICLYYFVAGVVPTSNNLYTLNYRRQMHLINAGKKRVSYFNLPEKDRRELKLSDKIKINNSMYIIDEFINNYGVSKQTKIRLLTADDDIAVSPTRQTNLQLGLGQGTATTINPILATEEMKEANNVNTSTLRTEGNTYTTNVRNAFVLGDNNRIMSNNVLVVGSDKQVEGEGIYTDNLVVGDVNVGNALSSLGTVYFNERLTQSGTSDPVIETSDLLGVTVAYQDTGVYTITFPDDLPDNIQIIVNNSLLTNGSLPQFARAEETDTDEITIYTFQGANLTNGILDSYITILQYG